MGSAGVTFSYAAKGRRSKFRDLRPTFGVCSVSLRISTLRAEVVHLRAGVLQVRAAALHVRAATLRMRSEGLALRIESFSLRSQDSHLRREGLAVRMIGLQACIEFSTASIKKMPLRNVSLRLRAKDRFSVGLWRR